jgi:hypothetical protein
MKMKAKKFDELRERRLKLLELHRERQANVHQRMKLENEMDILM